MEVDRSELMLGYVEPYYRESRLYKAQNNAKGQEFNILHTIIEDLPNQFNPQTATWGLRLWEELLDIDRGESDIERRRNQVLLKILSSQMITPIIFERILKNVTGTDIKYLNNVAAYTFEVYIISKDTTFGFDYNMIRKLIEDIKPAHLAYRLIGKYQAEVFPQIKYSNCLFMISEFYPRYNLQPIYLNGSWPLGGIYFVNGNKTILSMDFYPVYISFLSSLINPPELYLREHFIGNAYVKCQEYKSHLFIVDQVAVRPFTDSTIRFKESWSGVVSFSSQLCIEKDLWYLDGIKNLDGSMFLDADSWAYEL